MNSDSTRPTPAATCCRRKSPSTRIPLQWQRLTEGKLFRKINRPASPSLLIPLCLQPFLRPDRLATILRSSC